MKKLRPILAIIGAVLFIFAVGFNTGKGYQVQKCEKEVACIWEKVEKDFVLAENFFVESSYQYLEGHRLDLPEEISTVSWYDDKNFDLMAVFIDDSGDIHLGFTGKTISREQFLGKRDSLDLITEHSELTTSVHK